MSTETYSRRVRRARRPLLALVILLVALAVGYAVQASRGTHASSAPSAPGVSAPGVSAPPVDKQVALSTLPRQVAQTVALIQHHGPFPYSQDGVVFDNNEHLLPGHTRGYYHEYTVVTPGESTRGARRIITGMGGQYYYTADHYESFVPVDVTR
jgi:ribonuclease T1